MDGEPTTKGETGALTLAFDIGGSHLKAGVLSPSGAMVEGRVRVVTPKPAKPDKVVDGLLGLAKQLSKYDQVTIGFPGVVRGDTVLTAPNLGTKAWRDFRLAGIISEKLGKPVRMLNDATVQGLGGITGSGLECVLTMGTGMGYALFDDGRLTPHMEFSQHPIRNNKTYDEYVGAKALKAVGPRRWNKRVQRVISVLKVVVNYDVLYIGGGNARLLKTPLPDNVKTIDNKAGITGGVRVWDKRMDHAFAEHSPEFDKVAD